MSTIELQMIFDSLCSGQQCAVALPSGALRVRRGQHGFVTLTVRMRSLTGWCRPRDVYRGTSIAQATLNLAQEVEQYAS